MKLSDYPEKQHEQSMSQFSVEKRARIENVFHDEFAHAVHDTLQTQIPYEIAFVKDGKPITITSDYWQSLQPLEKKQINQEIQSNAANGIGFIYGRYKMSPHIQMPEALNQVFNWLNSEPVLNWMREFSGYQDIVAASAQATRYTPGNFLTRHNDINLQEQRRIAYVLSFNPEWHPDWGGLLQFFEPNGTPRDAWTPLFNAMSLFDVNHVHSVTYTTPFALRPRYSITGWFRATPL